MAASRFEHIDGIPDIEQIEEWAENYYQSLLTMMNPLFSHVNMNDVVDSLSAIQFNRLVSEELTGESAEIIKLAMECVEKVADREIEYIKAYIE